MTLNYQRLQTNITKLLYNFKTNYPSVKTNKINLMKYMVSKLNNPEHESRIYWSLLCASKIPFQNYINLMYRASEHLRTHPNTSGPVTGCQNLILLNGILCVGNRVTFVTTPRYRFRIFHICFSTYLYRIDSI